MHNASMESDVDVEFKNSEGPLCELNSGVTRLEYSLESVVTCTHCRTIILKVAAEREYELYDC